MQFRYFIIFLCCFFKQGYSQSTGSHPLSLDGYSLWLTGANSGTVQVIPNYGKNGLAMEGGKAVVHVRFVVNKYGEVHTPINASSAPNAEALAVDLSKSRYIKIKYKANQQVILQLRQTGVHGGTHNHVVLPPANQFTSKTIYFSSFKGGETPLDLKDVAKFNFAFSANNANDGFADFVLQSFSVDRYKP